MKIPIMSYWEIEKGKWDERAGKFTNRKVEKSQKMIEMSFEISSDSERNLLVFLGGPTGHESYYVEDLISSLAAGCPKSEKFYICAGTINRWPACWVSWEKVRAFITKGSPASFGKAPAL